MSDGQWLAQQTADDTVHVVPLDDVTVHEFTDDCVCVPTSAPTSMPAGRTGWVVTHHSLDGREKEERR